MRKLLISLFISSLAITAFAKPFFSNLIVLGDSLSDIGNFPETPTAFVHTPPKTLADLQTAFYIPITNPINENGYKVSLVQLFKLQHAPYQWPHLASRSELPAQPTIGKQARQDRSYNWPEFFLTDAYQDGLTASQSLLPWVSVINSKQPTSSQDSVDYAWASAMSIANCANYNYLDPTSCTVQSILAAQKNYAENRTPANEIKMQIPGSQKQVDLLLQDVANHRVNVGPNTLYAIWIGGNDMYADANILQHGSFSQILKALTNLLVGISWNNYLTINKLLSQPDLNAKHIYLFTLFDSTKMAPAVQGMSPTLKFLDSIVSAIYAKSLGLVVQLEQKNYPSADVQLVPAYDWFNAMAENQAPYDNLFPKANLGKACELSNVAYGNAQPPQANCQGYLFWNGVHPTMAADQIVGYLFEQQVAKTFDQPSKLLANVNLPMSQSAQKAWLRQQIMTMLRQALIQKQVNNGIYG